MGLTIGSDWRGAKYVSGSGTKVLIFRYEIAENDTDTDGITIRASASDGTDGGGVLRGRVGPLQPGR